MKELYERPDAVYVELMIHDQLMNAGLDYSFNIGEDDEEDRS